jgi:predicted nucleotidyltransferase
VSFNERFHVIIYEEILRAFQKEKVKYVLVGGIAFNILGGERSSHDLDILVEMTDNNLKKVVSILKRNGYKVKQPVDPMGIADKKTRNNWISKKNMKAFNFYKEAEMKEVDLIIDSPVQYPEAVKSMEKIKSGVLNIPVISIKKLIKMKNNTGRPIDKMDVASLKKIEKLKRKLK